MQELLGRPHSGSPEDWRVVVWDRGSQEFEALDCDMTDFLAGLVTGEIAPKEFPLELTCCDALFTPRWPEYSRPWSRMPPTGQPGEPVGLSWRLGLYGPAGVSECGVRKSEARAP